MPEDIIVVAGPTASGKSALALDMAQYLGGTIINADSMQIYRDLHILTARPNEAEMAGIPHRLYGILDAADLCSAARWAALAREAIAKAIATGSKPIIVGGTGLYIRTLLHGIAEVPAIGDAHRQTVRVLHRELGGVAFHAALASLDPQAAARLHPSDSQRLMRAYEVVTATGRPLVYWQGLAAPESRYRASVLLLMPDRLQLFSQCDGRFLQMMEKGALEEVRALVARQLPNELPVMKALGVPPLAAYLRGELTRDQAVLEGQQATRRYAKRQTTWFRHQLAEAKQVDTQLYFNNRQEYFNKLFLA